MNEYEVRKVKQLSHDSMKLGFSMGVVSMRLKVLEILSPYIDSEIMKSDLLTSRDVMRLVVDGVQDFENDVEFIKMKETIDGLFPNENA